MFITTRAGEKCGLSGENACFVGQPQPGNRQFVVYNSVDGKARFDSIKVTDVSASGGVLTLDLGTGTLPALISPATTQIRLADADTFGNVIEAIAYGTAQAAINVVGRSIGGTRVTNAATASGATMVRMSSYGYDTALVTTSSAFYLQRANSLWSGTNRETAHLWGGTPSGSTTQATWMTLDGTGLTITGVINAPNGLAGVTGGSFAQGSYYYSSSLGLVIGCKTGSVFDFSLYNPAGTVQLIGVETTFNRVVLVAGVATFDQTLGMKAKGTNTNDNAAATFIGEYVESVVASGSAVSLTTGVAANVTSISLGAGDWDVWGVVYFQQGGTTQATDYYTSISQTSATLGTTSLGTASRDAGTNAAAVDVIKTIQPPSQRISLAGTTTVYLVAYSTFTVSTNTAFGAIRARRRR